MRGLTTNATTRSTIQFVALTPASSRQAALANIDTTGAVAGDVLTFAAGAVSWDPPSGGAIALLGSHVLAADAAALDVTPIAGTSRHLLIVAIHRSTRAANSSDVLALRFNGDAGANYSGQRGLAGGAVASGTETLVATSMLIGRTLGATSVADEFSASLIIVPNYALTTQRKDAIELGGGREATGTTATPATFAAGTWFSTAAVTQVQLLALNGNMLALSSMHVYGLSSA